jgi:hypothetical protein
VQQKSNIEESAFVVVLQLKRKKKESFQIPVEDMGEIHLDCLPEVTFGCGRVVAIHHEKSHLEKRVRIFIFFQHGCQSERKNSRNSDFFKKVKKNSPLLNGVVKTCFFRLSHENSGIEERQLK